MARMRSPSPADGLAVGHSATSPQPLLSKRDKRRNQLAEKLAEMMSNFADNRDGHYRAQFTALTQDINLICKANPYNNQPLDDAGDEARESVQAILESNPSIPPTVSTDYISEAGKYYARFVDAVNDALEERDYNLTMLWNKHESTKDEIENSYLYKVRIAEEEHKLLGATIRERLTNTITQRANKLRREKEQLDLSDSNAMLLHPNQFSINNPASPGGPQAPRKTRRTGHKFGDSEDPSDNRRKRKFLEDNDSGSPGPSGRNADLGVASPFREAKARMIQAQFEAPAFSLDRLFTEKELNMALNQATIAASNFFAKMKDADAAQDGTTNGANGTNENGSEAGEAQDGDQDGEPAGAPEMSRQVSSNPHATRGATRSAFNPTAIVNGRLPFVYNPPYILDAKVFQKSSASAPPPVPLAASDVEQDLVLMSRNAAPDDPLSEKLLQAAVNPMKAREYQIQPPDFQLPVPEMTSHIRSIAPHLEVGNGMGGVPMSAQSSMAGYSDAGGNTPLGRLADTAGGVVMARTASGSGRRGGRRAQ
ncbi:hypothetical protein M011DRAFT_492893 [Sporormia fimetaria CBS 119925]|uniref:Sds3-like protein n=1 Tax=Sporormia fimetaria CBS 119925 TaxID=1340428 RepID=A0A6A6VH02_9PLEO|nr:hypothetical protein M011DRAFT_492893 [Sporormia fimetaria CBS 119925]